MDVTPDRILAYVRRRQEEKAANATINRELAAFKRMFWLAKAGRKWRGAPPSTMLEERNVRTGFFEPDQFRAVLAHLPAGPDAGSRGGVHHGLAHQ